MTVTVVNLKEDEYDVYIGRSGENRDNHLLNTKTWEPGWLGNPYPVSAYGRKRSIELYREAFLDRAAEYPAFRAAVLNLDGKSLGCFCKPSSCHGDVIKEYIEHGGGFQRFM